MMISINDNIMCAVICNNNDKYDIDEKLIIIIYIYNNHQSQQQL